MKHGLDQALAEHTLGNLDNAQAHYQRLSETDPQNAEVWHLLAIAYGQQGQGAACAHHAQKALDLEPNNPVFLNTLASAYRQQGLLDAAKTTYQQALTQTPDNPVLHNNLGVVALKENNLSQALEHFDRALAIKPHYAEAWFNQALVHLRAQDFERAMKALDHVIACDPLHPQAHRQRGQLFQHQGAFTLAIDAYRQALAHSQEPGEIHHLLGTCYMAQGQTDQAMEAWQQALVWLPDHLETHYNIGACLIHQRQADRALPHWLRVHQSQPDLDACYHVGLCYYYKGHWQDAACYFNQALTFDANHLPSHLNLGAISLKLGKRDQAIDHYQRVLRQDPQHPHAHYLMAALTEQTDALPAAPSTYVRDLFNDYADYFEDHLTTLNYRTPERLVALLQAHGSDDLPYQMLLDCGCGTGLCGPLLRPLTESLVGVDLSQRMLDKARDKGLYDRLETLEAHAFLTANPEAFDAIVAADFLPYLGDLTPFFRASFSALCPQGMLCFSTETHEGGAPWKLHAHARYSHQGEALKQLLIQAGFALEHCSQGSSRQQNHHDVPSLFILARRL